jgi:hypothetical protein
LPEEPDRLDAVRRMEDDGIPAAASDLVDEALDNADLDLRTLLENIDDQSDSNRQLNAAVTLAVKDSLVDRLRDPLP